MVHEPFFLSRCWSSADTRGSPAHDDLDVGRFHRLLPAVAVTRKDQLRQGVFHPLSPCNGGYSQSTAAQRIRSPSSLLDPSCNVNDGTGGKSAPGGELRGNVTEPR